MVYRPIEMKPIGTDASIEYKHIETDQEEEEQGMLMKVMDYLMRPNYASANVAKSIVKGDVEDIPSAAWRGITGEDKTTYRDVLTEAGWKDEDDLRLSQMLPILFSETGEGLPLKKKGALDFGAKGTVGLLGDIFLDPTTYVSVGAIAKGSKGLKMTKETVEALSTHLAKRTGKEIFEELIPYAFNKTGDDFVKTLATKLEKTKGLPEAIAKELSDNLVKRHTVTFFGKRVLPEFIDQPIVNATGKLASAFGNSHLGGGLKQVYNDLFVMGGNNPRLRDSLINITNMDAHTKQMFKHYLSKTNHLRKNMTKESNDAFRKALNELSSMSGIDNNALPNVISKYKLDEPAQQMLKAVEDINTTWYKELKKVGIDVENEYFTKNSFNPFRQPKIMTEEASGFWKYINSLESRKLKQKKMGTAEHGKRIFKVSDDSQLHEMTADWVFGIKQEDVADMLLDTARTVDEQAAVKLYLEYMENEIRKIADESAVGTHLGKWNKNGIRVHFDPENPYKSTIRVSRFGNRYAEVTDGLDEVAERLGARLDPWSIDESNDIFRDVLRKEGKTYLKSDDYGLRKAGKKMMNIKDDFKVFYDEAGVSVPARYLQAMENVRNKTFLDDLVRKFSYRPDEVLTPETMAKMGGDFPVGKAKRYKAGMDKERILKIEQFKNYLEERMPIDFKDFKMTGKKAKKFTKELLREARSQYGNKVTMEEVLNMLTDIDVNSVDDLRKPIFKLLLDNVSGGGSEKMLKSAMVLKNSAAQFKPNMSRIINEIVNTNPEKFNLLRWTELEAAVRELEKQGKRVGVYVTDDEWIKIYKESGIKGAKLKKLQEIFEDGEQGMLNLDSLKSFYQDFPTITRNIQAHIVDKDALQEMNRVYHQISEFKEVREMVSLYKKVFSFWKGHALLAPGFHFRNMVGNVSLNYLGGVYNPKAYFDAYKMSRLAHQYYKGTLKGKALEKFTKSKIGGKTLKQVWDDMAKEGVINRGFFASDLTHTLYDEIPEIAKKRGLLEELGHKASYLGFSQRRGMLKWNRQVGDAIESNARIAHYITKVKEGYTPMQAAKSVKKFLFDYADLTEAEKTFGKNILPFYTFMRKNIPLQFEQIVTNPGKQAVWGKLINAVQGDLEQKAMLPEWLKEQGGIQIGVNEDGTPRYFPLQSYLPFADISKIDSTEGGKQILSQVNPMFKLPFESFLTPDKGYSFFYNKPLEAFEGETEKLMGFLNIRKKYSNVARAFRLVNEIDRLVGVKSEGLSMGERLARLFTGARLYPFDEQKERSYFKKNVEREVKRIKSMAKYKSPEERKKLNEKIQELNKELRNKFWTASQQKKRMSR